MVRATQGVRQGTFYFQVVLRGDAESHMRFGWTTKEADIQAPVGFDVHGYAYRDISGSSVHNSKRIDAYGESFGTSCYSTSRGLRFLGPGDVVGTLICLHPEPEMFHENDNKRAADNQVVESDSTGKCQNFIKFFKNGVDQGVAFTQMPPGRLVSCVYEIDTFGRGIFSKHFVVS
jgi:hypothetical protein